MVNFPASLDSLANPGATTKRNDPGFELHTVISNLNDIAELLEAKVGIGATTPDVIHKTLKATAAGTTAHGYYGAVLLDSKIGTGSSGVIEFSSINQNFSSLLLVGNGRSSTAATSVACSLTFEASPTAAAYGHQLLLASGTSVSAAEDAFVTAIISAGLMSGASSPAGMHSSSQILMPEYASTTTSKNVSVRADERLTNSAGNVRIRISSGIWLPTTAISLIRLTLASGNWTTTSKWSLYGLPSA